jgi:hypothetical protein
MALSHQRDICKRCSEGPKWIKARGLCERCWSAVKADGHLVDWPRLDEMRRRHLRSDYCQCYSPIPQRLGLFNVSQCLKCGRKLPDG